MRTECPYCHKMLVVPQEYKEGRVRCGACHQVFLPSPTNESLELTENSTKPPRGSTKRLWVSICVGATGLALAIGFALGALLIPVQRDVAKPDRAVAKAEEGRSLVTERGKRIKPPNKGKYPTKSGIVSQKNQSNIWRELASRDQKRMENNMNSAGYKTYCNTALNEEGTIDIIMTSGSFKDSASSEAIDNYIAAAVATVGHFANEARWESRKLIIKAGFGKCYEISTSDCTKAVELFRNGWYQQSSDYTFSHLRETKSN